jgi:NADPH:quinone reductase-like Zn-dependent oxidoreductase
VLSGISGEFPLAEFFQRNAVMAGITVGSHEHQANMVRAFEEWQLKPVIDSHYPLHQLADAFRHQESQRHFGKIVVDIGE